MIAKTSADRGRTRISLLAFPGGRRPPEPRGRASSPPTRPRIPPSHNAARPTRVSRGPRTPSTWQLSALSSRSRLGEREGDETVAVGGLDAHQHGLAAILSRGGDVGLHVARRRHGLAADIED